MKSDLNYQVIVLDDFSNKEFRALNSEVSELFHVSYIELSENYGRAKVRNKLASLASQPWLLFLDGDSMIPDEDTFISRYIIATQSAGDIFYGGREYLKAMPKQEYQLHYHYGSKTESRNVSFRSKNPVLSFHSNNFLIKSDVFNQIKFNEEIQGYGYEDIAFAHQANQEGAVIVHLNNPIIHNQLDNNNEFLIKSQNALKNLFFLYSHRLIPSTRLISTYLKLKKMLILLPLKDNIENIIKRNLLKGKYQTWAFQFWKLLQYHKISSGR